MQIFLGFSMYFVIKGTTTRISTLADEMDFHGRSCMFVKNILGIHCTTNLDYLSADIR